MNPAATEHQRALSEAISHVRRRMENHDAPPDFSPPISRPSAALGILTHGLRLSHFERDLLVLAAAAEIDGPTIAMLVNAGAEAQRPAITFSMALRWLEAPHWSAFSPSSPLRRWRLLEVNSLDSLMHSPVRIDERVLHYLMGIACEDDRLSGILRPLPERFTLPQAHRQLAERAARALASQPRPVVQICGSASETLALAASVAQAAGIRPMILAAENLPHTAAEREALARLIEREVLLAAMLPLLNVHTANSETTERAKHFCECLDAPLFLLTRDPVTLQCPSQHFEADPSTPTDQREIWQSALGPRAAALNGGLDRVVRQFHFDASRIAATVAHLPHDSEDPGKSLWQLCRNTARQRLDALAQRIESTTHWHDLILPTSQIETLQELANQAAQRYRVYEEWGFAKRGSRGLGISALFAGPSGTGKTLAAEVIACELQLDLYRIDLSATVSKWLGDTEKNLALIFDAAEAGGAILLIDEADALFGRRSEVKDARDRYANMGVSYLLQRMETFRGLAILTTNQREALDSAFLRRLRFVINFPLPDIAQRRVIWERVFPATMPQQGLAPEKLARLTATGGAIRNIALNAAFAAAAANQAVTMQHLLRAARSEAAKADRPVNTSEVADWV